MVICRSKKKINQTILQVLSDNGYTKQSKIMIKARISNTPFHEYINKLIQQKYVEIQKIKTKGTTHCRRNRPTYIFYFITTKGIMRLKKLKEEK